MFCNSTFLLIDHMSRVMHCKHFHMSVLSVDVVNLFEIITYKEKLLRFIVVPQYCNTVLLRKTLL